MGVWNNVKTAILLAALTALLVVGGAAIGGPNGVKIALLMAVIMNFGGYWFSDKLALSMSGAQEVSPQEVPELYRIVNGLAQRAGIPMPRLYVIPDPTPNAFATG